MYAPNLVRVTVALPVGRKKVTQASRLCQQAAETEPLLPRSQCRWCRSHGRLVGPCPNFCIHTHIHIHVHTGLLDFHLPGDWNLWLVGGATPGLNGSSNMGFPVWWLKTCRHRSWRTGRSPTLWWQRRGWLWGTFPFRGCDSAWDKPSRMGATKEAQSAGFVDFLGEWRTQHWRAHRRWC